MQKTQTFHPFLRVFLYAFLMDILIFALVGIIYLLARWESIHQYGNGLVWAGVIGIFLLLLSAGWRNGRREELVGLSGVMPEHEVFYLLNRDNDARARFLFAGLIAQVIVFAVGLILLRVA
jgi:hypothetical protein